MLQGRLTRLATVAIAGAFVLGACGVDGTERGVIRENVIEPGITALNQSKQFACDGDAATIRLALEAYELFEGQPAPDEQTLIDGGFLRDESDRWDVVDGRLIAQDPDCGTVLPPEPVPLPEIVTESAPSDLLGVDGVLDQFTSGDIADVGGPACARQLAVVAAGLELYQSELGSEPDSLEQIEEAGYFIEPLTLWTVLDGALIPAGGSPCPDLSLVDADYANAGACRASAATLEVAYETYLAQFGPDAEPTEQNFVDAGFIGEPIEMVELVDGAVVAAPGRGCEGVELFPPR